MMMSIARNFLWLSLLGIGVQCQSLQVQDVLHAKLIVTSILDTPYFMLRESPQSNLTGNACYEGYIVDLVDKLSEILGFNYALKINEEHMYGSFDKNTGKWNGMIGEVVDGRAHIAAGAITITAEREKVVDFVQPFMNLGIGVLYKRPTKFQLSRPMFEEFVSLLSPFRYITTNLFLLLTLIFGIVLLILRRKYKTTLFRTLLGLWLLFLVLFFALYIAHLSSYYTNISMSFERIDEFSNIVDLAAQSSVVYGCIKGGSTEAVFRNAEDPFYSKMWSHMMASDPSSFVSNTVEGVERVLDGGYAFLTESTTIEYATERYCNLTQLGMLIDSKGHGLAVRQGSAFRELLNVAILKLQERGTLAQLKTKWWQERNGGGACSQYE